MDGSMSGWMNVRKDGWTDGWSDKGRWEETRMTVTVRSDMMEDD